MDWRIVLLVLTSPLLPPGQCSVAVLGQTTLKPENDWYLGLLCSTSAPHPEAEWPLMDVGVGVSGFVKMQGAGANPGSERSAQPAAPLSLLPCSISAAPVRAEGRGQLE